LTYTGESRQTNLLEDGWSGATPPRQFTEDEMRRNVVLFVVSVIITAVSAGNAFSQSSSWTGHENYWVNINNIELVANGALVFIGGNLQPEKQK
jgi:hypothetical protein